jgi:hypothetical protein
MIWNWKQKIWECCKRITSVARAIVSSTLGVLARFVAIVGLGNGDVICWFRCPIGFRGSEDSNPWSGRWRHSGSPCGTLPNSGKFAWWMNDMWHARYGPLSKRFRVLLEVSPSGWPRWHEFGEAAISQAYIMNIAKMHRQLTDEAAKQWGNRRCCERSDQHTSWRLRHADFHFEKNMMRELCVWCVIA